MSVCNLTLYCDSKCVLLAAAASACARVVGQMADVKGPFAAHFNW
jgi:NADPH-dependent curcumin reductase CurA